ncbi:MAG TPA: xanthine dehydrogenase family protein subunit M [Candidatus Limnocylindria bacterium]|nr:xanthine dehydrogenase family protein subunit M [Candidatus Limnocylindria bacterium]
MTFELHRAASADEARDLLGRYGDDAVVLAGGTAFALLWKQGLIRPAHVVDIHGVASLRGIARTNDGWLRIGALATHRDAERSAAVREHCPALAATFAHVATVRVRNQATVGGNLAHADPAQDPPVTLLALGAEVETTAGATPLGSFLRGPFETSLGSALLIAVSVPPLPAGTRAVFHKFLPRTADDYATVSVAAVRTPDGNVRVALGSVAGTAVRAEAVERAAGEGVPPREAAALVDEAIDPVGDARGSAEYKRRMARVWTERALLDLAA